jgi:hypothetical protein
LAAVGHGVAGIDAEVEQDLMDLGGVGVEVEKVGGEFGAEADGAREGFGGDFGDFADEVGGFEPGAVGFGP